MRNLYICILSSLLFACNTIDKSYILCENFNETISVNGKLFVDSLITNYPSAIECNDSSLIVFADGNKFINVFSIKSGKNIGSAGAKGRGVGEVISACFSGFCAKDNLISIYDATAKKINNYIYSDCDSTKVKYINSIINEYSNHLFSRLHCMDNGYKIGYSVFNSKDLLVLFDKEFKYIATFGDFPLKNISNFKSKVSAYITSHGNYISYVTIDFGYIALYEISGSEEIIKKWDKYMSHPIYSIDTKRDDIIFGDENLDGFMNVQMTDKYIYCVYSGKTPDQLQSKQKNPKPNEILVFDYDGNPIKKIIPNYPMYYFDVSSDDKYIYSYLENQTGQIIRYNI